MTKTNKSNKKKVSTELNNLITPAISLDRPEPKQLSTGQYLTLKCQNQPGQADSTTYNLSIPYFGQGSAEEWLMFLDNLNKGIVGQNITDGPGRYALAEKLLIGEMLTAFRTQSTARGNRTIVNFNIVMQDLASYVFKANDYRDQKSYMRRHMKKPRNLAIRQYVARVNELNSYLTMFPTGTVGQPATSLAEDEVKDLLFHGMPKSWQNKMVTQGFVYQDRSIPEFVSFCERMESIEEPSATSSSTKSTNKKKSSKKRKVRFESSDEDSDDEDSDSGPKYCKLHGKCSHTTDQCKDIKQLVKDEKDRRKRNRFKRSKYGNKYDKKSFRKKNKEEVNALVNKRIKKLMKKNKDALNDLNNFENIKLSEDEKSSSSSSSSESDSE